MEGLFLLFRRGAVDEANLRAGLDVVENYVLRTCLTDNPTTRDSYKAMPQVLKLEGDAVPEKLARVLFTENTTNEQCISTPS